MATGSRIVAAALFGLIVLAATAQAQQSPGDYPNRIIRIVTYAPGGGQDFAARIIAQGIAPALGQNVIVENRASGLMIAESVAKASPDGYTLMMNGTNFWIEPLLRKTPYDPLKDFAPVTLVSNSPNILVVHPSVPANSVKELIALAKSKPGVLNYVGAGTGTSSHLAAELFKFMAGVELVHLPTRSSGEATLTILRGEGQLTLLSSSSVAAHIKSGKLRALAVTSTKPSALAPELPTVSDTLPGYEIGAMSFVLATGGTPGPIVNRLNQEMVRVLRQAEVRDKFLSVGSEVIGSSPAQLATVMKSDMVRMAKLIKDAGIKADGQ